MSPCKTHKLMTCAAVIAMASLLSIFHPISSAHATTPCQHIAQCQQRMQANLYQHWKARRSYPGATMIAMVNNDLAGNIQIEVIKSSGFAAFDLSAVIALKSSLLTLDTRALSATDQARFKQFKLTLRAE